MKQQELQELRDYNKNPRSMAELGTDELRKYSGPHTLDWGPSLTKQSETDACDINKIVEKYTQTGFLPHDGRQPHYGDFSTSETFLEAQMIVRDAHNTFMELPAAIRAKFENDPAKFLAYVEKGATDPEVGNELLKMGLVDVPVEKPEEILKDIRANTTQKAPKKKQEPDSTASEG